MNSIASEACSIIFTAFEARIQTAMCDEINSSTAENLGELFNHIRLPKKTRGLPFFELNEYIDVAGGGKIISNALPSAVRKTPGVSENRS